jgi:deoxyadenosine/deoxycytidine kinase
MQSSSKALSEAVVHVNPASPLVLSVEGNIAVGKSTLCDILRRHWKNNDDVIFMKEPVDRWKDVGGFNLLDEYYKNPEALAFPFQVNAFLSRLEIQMRAPEHRLRIMERSPLSDWCFAENCHEMDRISDIEMAIYNNWWSFFPTSLGHAPRGIIYLRTTPETCLERAQSRSRNEECGLDLEYLRLLHAKHEEMFGKSNDASPPVCVIDASPDLRNDVDAQFAVVEAIETFVSSLVSGS